MNHTEKEAFHCKNMAHFLLFGLDSCTLTFKDNSFDPSSVQINEETVTDFFEGQTFCKTKD